MELSARWRHRAQYGTAVLATGISLAARQFLTPELGLELPYITLFPAIAFSAWLGGFGPGALCTLLSVLVAAYLWVPSTQYFARLPTLGDGIGIVLFCGVGLFVSVLAEARLRAQSRAEAQVAEVRQAQERERQARDEAEQANKAKDEFLAIVAHELRQPLAAMMAALGVLRQRVGAEALSTERSIGVLERQIAHLQRLVDDLLDATRVVRGQIVLQRRPLNALDVVMDAIEAVRPRAHERHQRLECRLPDAPVIVEADATRLQQVVLNVLSNAVRYTPPEGDIRILVEPDSAWLTIQVHDSGEGIAPDDLPRIFSLFTRAGEQRGTGLGIGLAVARSLVELHGGTIDASSDGPGRGSEFRIQVPLATSGATAVRHR
jgi:signal transduction histidine kinase